MTTTTAVADVAAVLRRCCSWLVAQVEEGKCNTIVSTQHHHTPTIRRSSIHPFRHLRPQTDTQEAWMDAWTKYMHGRLLYVVAVDVANQEKRDSCASPSRPARVC